MRKLELLAPARNVDSGRAAVDYGADALYVGGPAFGARVAAGNTIEDIAQLVDYARPFGVRVYATLNTLVYEDELAAAERTARELIASGVDALIVQDMAFMRMGLEGVELHASTQTCNTTPEKVRFLGESGFSRVILERGLSLDEIRAIRAATDTELECFVHGAICVGFSGQCYLSRSMGTRSGNRGDCMQACRLSWDLEDAGGNTLLKNKHLLSVADLDLSGRLGELVDAGICSFKIEGRLKDTGYVKNVTAHYRLALDRIIASRDGLRRSSDGRTMVDFAPDPSRSFTRGGSEWLLDGQRAGLASFDTPKATGARLGAVARVGRDWFETDGTAPAPGDGICFVAGGELAGTNINRVEGRRAYPNRMDGIVQGITVFRNHDHAFETMLEQSRTRTVIDARAEVAVEAEGVRLTVTDSAGVSASASLSGGGEPAKDPAKMEATLRAQIAKSGDTIFSINKVAVAIAAGVRMPFVPVSAVNSLRREALERLHEARLSLPPVRRTVAENRGLPYPAQRLGGEANVTNSLAERFYRDHGVVEIDRAFDLRETLTGECVMTSGYCLRRETGRCLRGKPSDGGSLWLVRGRSRYRLEFDCSECRMRVIKEK
ncbi:U32 family peptidase [Alistipes sp. OttesenSCG-928-B03]|nr:U32 family peptidase [Alistipes sp. OttesenSCG-928-B03]